MSDDPRFFIRPTGGDFTQVTEEQLLAAGPGPAAGSCTAGAEETEQNKSCGPACSEGHTYEGRCSQSAGNACVWPDCLSDGQQAELAAQVIAAERGEETTVGPDQRLVCGCNEAPAPAAASQSRTTPDNPATSGDAADNSGTTFTQVADAWRWDRPERPGQTEATGVGYLTEAEARADFALYDAEDRQAATDDELTAEEARDLADQLGLELYQAQDAVAFVEECCVIADREGLPVTTALVREWLQGPKCARQMAAEAIATLRNAPDLRELVAAAIRTRLCQDIASGRSPLRGEIGAYGAATEYDLADAVLAVVDDNLPERAQAAIRALKQQRDTREERLDAIREYVKTSDDDGIRTREQVLRILGPGGEVGP